MLAPRINISYVCVVFLITNKNNKSIKSLLERLNEIGDAEKAKTDKLRDTVKHLLLKRGNRADDVEEMVKRWFDFVVKSYPDATASGIADRIRNAY